MITQSERKFCILIAAGLLLAGVSGCASHSVDSQSAATPRSAPIPGNRSTPIAPARVPSLGERAAEVALSQVGAPYQYGGNTHNGFDCSGLVQFSYARAGLDVPRTTGQLWAHAAPVTRHDIRVGDLLFFSFEGKMSHVGMYVGERQFVHAPSSGRRVSVASLDSPYYARALLRAGRPE